MTDVLKAKIVKHDQYYTRVIDMIPGELYKHTVSEDADGAQESKYHNKRKLPLTHDERKNISKAKKAEKYAAPSSAASNAVASTPVESAVVESEPAQPVEAGDMDGLRQRLQARIMSLKGQRVSNKPVKDAKNNKKPEKTTTGTTPATAATPAATAAAGAEKKNDAKKNAVSAQETEQAAKRVRRTGAVINDASDVSIVSVNSTGSDDHSIALTSITSAGSLKKASVDSDLQFNLIAQPTVLGAAAGEGESNAKNSKPKGTKLQRLQKLLAEAEKKRARMKQLTAHGGEEGLIRLQGEKWNDALKSARGEKTIIVGSSSIEGSEGKLKNALKKREKKKQKSAEAWADRIGAVEDAEKVKIQKREGNINQRRMKMKGVEVEAEQEAAPIGNDKQPVGAGSGRKRLFHVLKYGNSEENGHAGEKGAGNNKHHDNKGKSGGGGGHKSGGGGNRAGFEGKKKVGEYLNK